MCRPISDGRRTEDPRLRIRSFHHRLRPRRAACLPEEMMLVFLPTGVDGEGGGLEINGAKVAPGLSAAAVMCRVPAAGRGGAEYVSVERVRAGAGVGVVRFEVWAAEERVAEGVFRRRGGEGWGIEWRCGGKKRRTAEEEAEVWAVAEGGWVVAGRRGRCCGLEEIPEEREIGWVGSDGCDCSGREGDGETSGTDEVDEMDGGDEAMWMERVELAVDLGLWVVCLGVGLLISNVGLRRK